MVLQTLTAGADQGQMKTHPSAHAGRSAEHSTAGRAAPAIVKLYHSPHVTFVLHSINFYYQLQRIKRRIRNSHFGERKKKKYIMRLRGCIPRDAENSHSLKHTHTHTNPWLREAALPPALGHEAPGWHPRDAPTAPGSALGAEDDPTAHRHRGRCFQYTPKPTLS